MRAAKRVRYGYGCGCRVVSSGGGVLPVGMQTFREVRESGGFYVDKTAFAARMIAEGKCYFLSRPRRFGKSVFIDTLKELFEGLAVHGGWDWSVRHPVVRLSFGRGDYTDRSYLPKNAHAQLDAVQRSTGVESLYTEAPDRFAHMLEELHRRWGRRVVVLVDEYDKPILDALGDSGTARANRDFLRGFYATVKDSDEHVRFVLLTGVSKFSKVSLFSGLNNLDDITLNPAYSAICGFTEAELDRVFSAELEGLDRQRVREWYNGYSWLGDEKVYNPFDVLKLLRERVFGSYWFETGSPGFLIDILMERRMPTPRLGGTIASGRMLSAFDVDRIGVEALLFQSGYLTVVGKEDDDGWGPPRYRLDYPNLEVRQSLNDVLLERLAVDAAGRVFDSARLRSLLANGDAQGVRDLFEAFYASIPYEWHTRNEIARFEGYYASVFYSCFAASGLDVVVEDSTSLGHVDMAVRTPMRVWLFEFKIAEASQRGEGLRQMNEAGVRRQVPSRGRGGHTRGGRVQPQDPQHRKLRNSCRLTRPTGRHNNKPHSHNNRTHKRVPLCLADILW